jgi:glycosyltransferase involved in cell wall biosynthesis
MNTKLVSIALCAYNGKKFLEQQIDSILNQSYKNIELIIVDDNSTDNTIDIINRYIKYDNRIRLYKNSKNIGFIKNFEKAISLCTGEYICLCDQDDIWLKDKVKILVENIKDNTLIYSNASLVDEDGNDLNKSLVDPEKMIKGNNNKAFILNNCVSGNTLMFKKELIEHILPIPKKVSLHDIWIAFVATTYGNITYVEESLVKYRRYSGQITADKQKHKQKFSKRFQNKNNLKLQYANRHLNNMNVFLNLDILKDKDTILILNELKKHFESYDKILYNSKLNKILKKYKNELFALENKDKVNKQIFKYSTGLKFHKYSFFMI